LKGVNQMALIRWEPVPVNRLFTSLFDTQTVAAPPARRFAAPTDIAESDTHYLVRMDLPGVSEDDISVELDGNVLTISGQRAAQQESRQGGYYRYERSSGSFRRSIRVPEGVDADAIEANFDRGVLEVSVPKPEQVKPRKVAITVGSTAPARDASDAPAQPAEAPVAVPESSEPAAA
jgi:HSP20 family protein